MIARLWHWLVTGGLTSIERQQVAAICDARIAEHERQQRMIERLQKELFGPSEELEGGDAI